MKQKIYFFAERDPESAGKMCYRVGGVGYLSIKELHKQFPSKKYELTRIKATRRNRLFA